MSIFLPSLVLGLLPELKPNNIIVDVSGYGGGGFSEEPKTKYVGLSLNAFFKDEFRIRHDTYLKQYLLAMLVLSLSKDALPVSFKAVNFYIFDASRRVVLKDPVSDKPVSSSLTLNIFNVSFEQKLDKLHGFYVASCVADIMSLQKETQLQVKLARVKETVSEATHTVRGQLTTVNLAKSNLEDSLKSGASESKKSILLKNAIRLLGTVVESVNASLPKKSELDLTPEKKTKFSVEKL